MEMERTYIETADRHSQFYLKLHSELRLAGVEVVDSPATATSVFKIESDITDQRVLAVSARNVPAEYEVFYTVVYSLQAGERMLMNRHTQTKTRDYTWDETRVLGKTAEEQQLREALVDDLVRVVMIQLASL